MGGSHAVTSGDSKPDLGIKISHYVPIIATFKVTPKLVRVDLTVGWVGSCSIWGFHICSQNWGQTLSLDYSLLGRSPGFVVPTPTPKFFGVAIPRVAKISH